VNTKFQWIGLSEYEQGIVEGMTMFAWWKDGTQYVGTCGTTLEQAVDEFLIKRGHIKQPITRP
jgi:hypothetical protein